MSLRITHTSYTSYHYQISIQHPELASVQEHFFVYVLTKVVISDNGDPLEASYRTKVLDIYPPCPANFDPAATKEVRGGFFVLPAIIQMFHYLVMLDINTWLLFQDILWHNIVPK